MDAEKYIPKCVVLWGVATIGKTSTLKVLIDLLSTVGSHETIPRNGEDDCVIFTINSKKIAVTTRGDDRESLECDFEAFGSCDLYVCAARTKGDTWKFLKEKFEEKELLCHAKWSFSNRGGYFDSNEKHAVINQLQAAELFEEIKAIVC